jgi:hypothetical protein
MGRNRSMERFTVDVPPDLADAARRAASEGGLTYRGVFLQGAKDWLTARGYYALAVPSKAVAASALRYVRTGVGRVSLDPSKWILPDSVPPPIPKSRRK